MSVNLRRVITGPSLRLIIGVVGLVSGEVSGVRSRRAQSNARLMLRRARDGREREAKLLAERLGSDRLEITLMGSQVRVEMREGELRLMDPRKAVVGRLVALESQAESLFRYDGSGLGGLVYWVGFRSDDERRSGRRRAARRGSV